jgi:hypothetical protein
MSTGNNGRQMFLECRAWQRSESKAHKTEDTRIEITKLSVKYKQVTKLLTNPEFVCKKQDPTAK